MRTEAEMYDLILNIAKGDDRVRAVYQNGSRTNPNVPKDIFQDYDIVYVVEETKSFREDKEWINQFGKILFMQYADESVYYESEPDKHYTYLMQFEDGNRIDLTVQTIAFSEKDILEDHLCRILLDKDGILPEIPDSTDEQYWVKSPSLVQFLNTCNEFWWMQDNIAKGLWRKEIPYVMEMMNSYERPMLTRMLSWKAGIATNFSCSVGKCGKYLDQYVPKTDWESYLSTYPTADLDEMWKSALLMCDLFDKIAKEVALKMKFTYNETEANNSFNYLKKVKTLD